MSNSRLLGVYGGTFDPIHHGHLAVAQYVIDTCQLDHLCFLPCHIPPHRNTPGVSSEARATMVELAIAQQPKFSLDRLELQLAQPSYTVNSLHLLQQKHADTTLCFVMGMDSLCYFKQWHQWQNILKLAHLIVLKRPGYPQHGDVPALLAEYAGELADLHRSSAGRILVLNNPDYPQSATQIRAELAHSTQRPAMLPENVWQYIVKHQLYCSDSVSIDKL